MFPNKTGIKGIQQFNLNFVKLKETKREKTFNELDYAKLKDFGIHMRLLKIIHFFKALENSLIFYVSCLRMSVKNIQNY